MRGQLISQRRAIERMVNKGLVHNGNQDLLLVSYGSAVKRRGPVKDPVQSNHSSPTQGSKTT
jgi:hypothetical protein